MRFFADIQRWRIESFAEAIGSSQVVVGCDDSKLAERESHEHEPSGQTRPHVRGEE